MQCIQCNTLTGRDHLSTSAGFGGDSSILSLLGRYAVEGKLIFLSDSDGPKGKRNPLLDVFLGGSELLNMSPLLIFIDGEDARLFTAIGGWRDGSSVSQSFILLSDRILSNGLSSSPPLSLLKGSSLSSGVFFRDSCFKSLYQSSATSLLEKRRVYEHLPLQPFESNSIGIFPSVSLPLLTQQLRNHRIPLGSSIFLPQTTKDSEEFVYKVIWKTASFLPGFLPLLPVIDPPQIEQQG